MKLYLISYLFVIYLSPICGQYFQQFGEPHNSYDTNSLGSNDQSSRQGSGSFIVPIAYTRQHPIEYVDYKQGDSEERPPPTIHFEGGNSPLNIIFSPRLSHLSVADRDDQKFRDSSNEKYTYFEEEPIITYHEVNTPVFEDRFDQPDYHDYQDNQSNNQYVNGDLIQKMIYQESQ